MRPHPDLDMDDHAGQARDWVLALASGTLDDAGMQAFERWLAQPGHRLAFERERVLWRSLGPAPAAGRPRRRRRTALLAAAAVAVLACVAAMPGLLLQLRADHRSGNTIAHLQLPDGSRAVLDADSAIALHFDAGQRRVELLRGRAWFEVVPGQAAPFRVSVGDGVVEDIATAFVVARAAGRVETAVEHGRIRAASTPGRPWTYLATGQGAGWHDGGALQRLPDRRAEDIAAWRHGELLLDAVPVDEAIARLQPYRAGRIVVQGDLSALPSVNAALRTDHPEAALDALAAGSGLVVTRLPFGVALVRRQPAD
ncbi:FecR domain-containing protein [Xanthomonas sp. XNM01]|uniref:FecR family protein n=1 Tax=Xanthomonas sp. XNM01 TaxID=2769289 RepID=UPI00177D50A0|nr:FecR domain-containing protein [Xanthomonas sp. XNM01]MBD9367312.1 FecR domain-containing protein [Xanthomonas sp. XNM01]